jgi:hypothetical protein
MDARSRRRLTLVIKRYLDVVWYVCLVGVIAVPVGSILIGFNKNDSGGPAPEAPVVLRFYVDQSALADAELADDPPSLARGQGELRIRTRSKQVWFLILALVELVLFVLLYGVRQMRAVFSSLLSGEPFSPRNPARIRKIGFVVMGWHLLTPFLKYLSGLAVLQNVEVRGLMLKPPIDFSFDGLVFGLALVVLAEVFHQASTLQREQSLTV